MATKYVQIENDLDIQHRLEACACARLPAWTGPLISTGR